MCMFKLSDLIILISKVIKLYFTLMSSITYFISLPIVWLSQYSILVYVPGFHITLVLYFKLVFSWILMRLITGAYFHNVSLAFGNLFFFIFQKSLYLLFIFLNYPFLLFFFFFFCGGFCHTLKWNSHGFSCVPHPYPPSHLPLGFPSAAGPSACLMHPTWAGDLFHPR